MSYIDKDNVMEEGFFSKILQGLKKDKVKAKKDKSSKKTKYQKALKGAEKQVDDTRKKLIKLYKDEGIPIPDYLK